MTSMSPPKLLACHACSRGYMSKVTAQNKKRCPALLDCGHSVCEGCVRSAASKGPLLACPQCQQLTVVEDKKLPSDAFINGCLVINMRPPLNEDAVGFVTQRKPRRVSEKAMNSAVSEKDKCEECNVNHGSLTCPKCEDCRFCQSCFNKVHQGSRLLSRHVPRAATPAAAGSGDGGAAAADQCCPLHERRPLEYYCTDDDVAVCSHCSISGEHKGHTVETVSERNARRRPELLQATERARNTYLRLRVAAQR
ncbi:E3 ubiquitin-protein ligase Midline-1-like [Pollicipes pollicipes]|uniref:E3 ubiquitin-protein ligase Midline-1-like n=1 Tax=Pollicipes pollicipes TaxID=41117 RepID=UPI001884C211|nr:E3 ubiquitin-protein ligase Midline-1-like [Pollicipes pollicipes]